MKGRTYRAAALLLAVCLLLAGCANNGTLSTQPAPTDTAPSTDAVRPSPEAQYCLYVKDGQLFYAGLSSSADAFQLTTDLYNEEVTNIGDRAYLLQYGIKVSSDGTRILYPQQVDYSHYSLYYRDLTDPDGEPLLIDTGLYLTYNEMEVNQTFDCITYLKDRELYQHDLTEKILIASDVREFYVSPDGRDLWFRTFDDELYLKKGVQEAQLVATGVTRVIFVNEAMDLFFYSKSGALCKRQGTEPEVQIAPYADTIMIKVHQDGTAYYAVEQGIVSFEEMFADSMTDSYREQFRDATFDSPFQTLYYYDGEESTVICDTMLDWEYWADNGSVVAYSAIDRQVLSISQVAEHLTAYGDQYDLLESYREAHKGYYLAAKTETANIPLENIDSIYISLSQDGKFLYIIADTDGQYGSLYQLTLDGAQIINTRVIDEDAYRSEWRKTADGKSTYFKDVTVYKKDTDDTVPSVNYSGSLYLDGKHIDDDVSLYSATYADGILYYVAEWNLDLEEGVIKRYDGEKTETVLENIFNFQMTSGGYLLIESNRSEIDGPGELWVAYDGELRKIADDVVGLAKTS